MPYAPAAGARIYYEVAGHGTPIVFVHEFGGDYRSWDDQMRYFSRGYRCITLSQRGYPKSDCPDAEALYGQDIQTADVIAVMDAAGVDKAHVVGLSMGGYTTLQVGMKHAHRVRSLTAAGAGSGSPKDARPIFVKDCQTTAAEFDRGQQINATAIGNGATRIQLKNKDPLGWQRFVDNLAEHPAHAAAKTLRNVQAKRASLYDLEAQLKGISTPTFLIVGDEDEPCLDVNLWMKRLMPSADFALLPGSGHAVNLEEPALFNMLVERFIARVDLGQWRPRDPLAVVGVVHSMLSASAALKP